MRIEPAIAQTVQIISVAIAAVVSVLSFNSARTNEAYARSREAQKSFLETRQKLYLDAIHTAAVLGNPEVHSSEELNAAKKRFRQLYVAELSMVESSGVETAMVDLAKTVDRDLLKLTDAQKAAYDLAHKLAASFSAEQRQSGR